MQHQIPGSVVGPVLRIGQNMIDYFRGRLKASPPRFVFFYATVGTGRRAVILIETHLRSTVDKAWHVESMRVQVTRGEGMQSFSQWHFEESGELSTAGLSVLNGGRHLCVYFQLPDEEQDYQFLANSYCINMIIACDGRGERTIHKAEMIINKHLQELLKAGETGIEFTWQEASKKWVGRSCQIKGYNDKIAKRY